MTTHRIDTDIQKDILAELKWDPQVRETDIGVIVKDGAVTLKGSVPFYSHKYAAKNAVKRIRGVRALVDEIEVHSVHQMEGSDKDIAEHIAHLFEWNTQIPGDDIRADVDRGTVILSGEVDWQYQRDYAQKQVETIKGVRSVFNNIVLRQSTVAPGIRKEIAKALHRHAGVEARNITVSVVDGTVTLTGHADSYLEIDLVEDAVWGAPGVTRVINRLTITPLHSEPA